MRGITTLISVRQLFSVDSTVDKVRSFCSILHLALLGMARTWLRGYLHCDDVFYCYSNVLFFLSYYIILLLYL